MKSSLSFVTLLTVPATTRSAKYLREEMHPEALKQHVYTELLHGDKWPRHPARAVERSRLARVAEQEKGERQGEEQRQRADADIGGAPAEI